MLTPGSANQCQDIIIYKNPSRLGMQLQQNLSYQGTLVLGAVNIELPCLRIIHENTLQYLKNAL